MKSRQDDREIISAKVSAEAAKGWKKFCEANGITLTAMIEIAGRELASEPVPPVHPTRVEMVQRARKVDIERRSRKRG